MRLADQILRLCETYKGHNFMLNVRRQGAVEQWSAIVSRNTYLGQLPWRFTVFVPINGQPTPISHFDLDIGECESSAQAERLVARWLWDEDHERDVIEDLDAKGIDPLPYSVHVTSYPPW